MIQYYSNEAELKNYFEDIFNFDESVPYSPIEILGEAPFIKYNLRYQRKKLVLYGAGKIGFITLIWLRKEDIQVEFVIDTDEKKKGKNLLGVPIVGMEQLDNARQECGNYVVLITTALGMEMNSVILKLFEKGIKEIKNIHYPDFHTKTTDLSELNIYNARIDFEKVFDKLEDIQSKEVLCESLRCRLYDDNYRLKSEASCEKYWGRGIYKHLTKESLLCLRAASGDTLFYFLDQYKQFQHVFCFEPECGDRLRKNLQILPPDLADKVRVEEYYAAEYTAYNTVRIDDWVENREISIITMDIEGMEIRALEGGQNTIKKFKPVLALSAYHKWDDLIVFINFVSDISSDYHFYLRKYGARLAMSRNEIVLYAVPEERMAIQ